jgi:hypothetical protein
LANAEVRSGLLLSALAIAKIVQNLLAKPSEQVDSRAEKQPDKKHSTHHDENEDPRDPEGKKDVRHGRHLRFRVHAWKNWLADDSEYTKFATRRETRGVSESWRLSLPDPQLGFDTVMLASRRV